MALKYNTTTITSAHNVKYNSTACKFVKYGTTTVWRKGVTLTNIVGNSAVTATVGANDAGAQTQDVAVKANGVDVTYNITNGHRYFCRANLTGYSYHYSDWPFAYQTKAQFCGQTIKDSGYKNEQFSNTDFGTNNVIIAANNSTTKLIAHMYSNGSSMTSTTATFYMVVDITELESAVGRTLSVDEVWSYFGSANWYGSKEISL